MKDLKNAINNYNYIIMYEEEILNKRDIGKISNYEKDRLDRIIHYIREGKKRKALEEVLKEDNRFQTIFKLMMNRDYDIEYDCW